MGNHRMTMSVLSSVLSFQPNFFEDFYKILSLAYPTKMTQSCTVCTVVNDGLCILLVV
jgi:hypothetical protein